VNALELAALLTKLKLEHGLMSPAKALEWARAKAKELGDPPYFLVEILRMREPSARELCGALDDAIGRVVDPAPGVRALLGGLCDPLSRNHRLLDKLAAVLARIGDDLGASSPQDLRRLDRFLLRLEAVDAGRPAAGDSRERILKDLTGFLGRFREVLRGTA
jgi:hypothetical protein